MAERRCSAAMVAIVVLLGLFATTVPLRAPWRAHLSRDHHQWLTASSLIFARNWYREGLLHLGMMSLEEPLSGEARTIPERSPYVSYPPGATLPIWAIARIAGREPSAPMIMWYGLANQLGILFLLAATALVSLRVMGVACSWRFALGCVPPFIYLYAPGPFYFHQNVYFADQAVMLPFALLLFLEAGRAASPMERRGRYDLLQAATLFWGAFTDWLFLPAAATLWLLRLVEGGLGRTVFAVLWDSARLFLPVGLAYSLFLLQLACTGQLGLLVARFEAVAGLGEQAAPASIEFLRTVFVRHVDSGYGSSGFLAFSLGASLVASGVLAALGRRRESAVLRSGAAPGTRLVARVLILATAPCLVHAFLVPLHAMGHDFSVLKLGLAVALGPFCLLPAAIVQGARWRFGPPWLSVLYVVPIAAALWHFSAVDRRAAFPPPWDALPELAAFFEEHIRRDDAVFSPDFVVPRHPPQLLAYTMKRVRRAHSLSDVRAWAEANPNHEGDFVIVSLRSEAADETAFPPMRETSEIAGIRWVRLERKDVGQELGRTPD